MKEAEIKAKVLDRIVAHLQRVAVEDHRKRERMRAKLALKNISKCTECVIKEHPKWVMIPYEHRNLCLIPHHALKKEEV